MYVRETPLSSGPDFNLTLPPFSLERAATALLVGGEAEKSNEERKLSRDEICFPWDVKGCTNVCLHRILAHRINTSYLGRVY